MQRKEIVSISKDIENLVRCKGQWYLRQGEPVSANEHGKVQDAIILWCLAIGDSIGWRAWDKRTRHTWVDNLFKAKLVPAVEFFKEVDVALCKSHNLGDFRSRIRTQCVHSFKALLAPFEWSITDFYAGISCGEAAHLAELRTCFLFLGHLTVNSKMTESLSYEKFQKNYHRLSETSSRPSEYQKRQILTLNLPSPYSCFCKHGNGSVAEQATTKQGKRPISEYQKWLLCNTARVRFYLKRCGVLMEMSWPSTHARHKSRMTTVPKGLGERRVICPEPVDLMFLQQSVSKALCLSETRLRCHYLAEDQTPNANAALIGSYTEKFSCIDLSSASDSVRWTWVWDLFEYRKDWRFALSMCRSKTTETPFGEIANIAFAPMGSALCAPMETIVFCMLVEEAYHNLGMDGEVYYVYNDDIVIRSEAYDECCRLLEYAGFEVNKNKSFGPLDPPFREACGGHYYNGIHCKPIQLSRKFLGLTSKNVTNFEKLVDLCNRCFALLPTVRWYVLRCLMTTYRELPFTNDVTDSSSIYTTTDLFSSQLRGWNRDADDTSVRYQRRERLETRVVSQLPLTAPKRYDLFGEKVRGTVDKPYSAAIAYFKWHLSRDIADRDCLDTLDQKVFENECSLQLQEVKSKLATQWLPTETLRSAGLAYARNGVGAAL